MLLLKLSSQGMYDSYKYMDIIKILTNIRYTKLLIDTNFVKHNVRRNKKC
jgi:hypothetical protein